MSGKALRNAGTGAVLVSFVCGVYYWTTVRVKATDLFSSVGSELDEARAIKAGSGSGAGSSGSGSAAKK
jgi:hypothetical protein